MITSIRKQDYYRDSVFLMQLGQKLLGLEGIDDVAVMMGTDANKSTLQKAGLFLVEMEDAKPSDLLIAVASQQAEAAKMAIETALELLEGNFSEVGAVKRDVGEKAPRSIQQAKHKYPDAEYAVISLPGIYAAAEARMALHQNLNVLLFSDNVTLQQEKELKEEAKQLGKLLMGPDCGTAIMNGVPLGFANVVRKGNIGIVGASGTGIQECTTLIDRFGYGITQAVGTGGRDLSEEIGGETMLAGIRMLEDDPQTEIILVISKPPALTVADKILKALAVSQKKVILNLIGYRPGVLPAHILAARTLEEVIPCISAHNGGQKEDYDFWLTEEEASEIYESQIAGQTQAQCHIVGLFSGGTLCDDAQIVLEDRGLSNSTLTEANTLGESEGSLPQNLQGHLLLDLGDDRFTQGRPHPMIDMTLRQKLVLEAAACPAVSVLLMDIVLGYGGHEDPAGAMAKTIREAKAQAQKKGGCLSVIVSISGTDKDKQNRSRSKAVLEDAGAVVLPTNAQAAKMAVLVSGRDREKLADSTKGIPLSGTAPASGAETASAATVLNLGLEGFAQDINAAGATACHIEWKPIYGGDPAMAYKLSQIL